MKYNWIHCEDGSRLYIGPFWMGTPKQIADTQDVIDEEIDLYGWDEEEESEYDYEYR